MTRMRAFLMMAAMAAVAVPVAAGAQRSNAPTADELQARAEALHGTPTMYAVAARLYARASALRPITDPRGVENLVMAGRLLAYAGQYDRARWVMEVAAERALMNSDAVAAAYAYLNAAFVAGNYAGDVRALDLTERVIWLSNAPGVTPEQKADVLRRVGAGTVQEVALFQADHSKR